MPLRPICEPIELPPGTAVIAERVESSLDAPASGRLLHFHDVSELVLFGRVDGDFYADGRRFPLTDGTAIFVPSMRHHDFDLRPGPKDWVLVQIDPYLTEHLALQPSLARLGRPFCVSPESGDRERLDLLASWLIEAAADDPAGGIVIGLVELLLTAVASAPEAAVAEPAGGSGHVDRLLPAVERLRRHPGESLSLAKAAALCRLSPAYFSRRFKHVFGLNFTDYSRAYRLHLAGRRIASSDAALSEIAYALGFSSASHFSARFHQRFGMTPREYRRTARLRRPRRADRT